MSMLNVFIRMCGDAFVRFGDEFVTVTIFERVSGAGFHTGGFLSIVDALRAEGAFVDESAVDNALVIVKVRNAERTGVHAVATANAQIGIVSNGTIFRFGVRADRTCRHAVGVIAVHTVIDHCAAL